MTNIILTQYLINNTQNYNEKEIFIITLLCMLNSLKTKLLFHGS